MLKKPSKKSYIFLLLLLAVACAESGPAELSQSNASIEQSLLPDQTPAKGPILSDIEIPEVAEETEEAEGEENPDPELALDISLFGVEECFEEGAHYLWVWIRAENIGENLVRSWQLLEAQPLHDLRENEGEESAISSMDTLPSSMGKTFHNEQHYCGIVFEDESPIIATHEGFDVDAWHNPYEGWDPDKSNQPSQFLAPGDVGFFNLQYSLEFQPAQLVKRNPYFQFCSQIGLKGFCIEGSLLVEYLLDNTDYVNNLKFSVMAIKNANCRAGPSQEYNETGFIGKDDSSLAVGRSEDSRWLLVQLREDLLCWVYGQSLDIIPWNIGYLPVRISTARRLPPVEPTPGQVSDQDTADDDESEIDAIVVGKVCESVGITVVQGCFETCPEGWNTTGEACTNLN